MLVGGALVLTQKQNGYGGAVYMGDGSFTAFSPDSRVFMGGAVYMRAGSFTAYSSTFANNQATSVRLTDCLCGANRFV